MKSFRLTLSLIGLALLLFALPLVAYAQQPVGLQYFRPYDQRGIYFFEPPKIDTVGFDGFDIYWGAAFTQQLQMLDHSNEAEAVLVDGVNVNELIEIGTGFNLATANLYLGAQLADGVRVNLTTYLSSRHHPESWVKGGYVQVDRLPMLRSQALDNLMDYLTLRVGHFEINYGDGHFRRTDNGMAMWNPFVGNYLMDAFATEIGGEVYFQTNGFLAMGAVTGGEIRGTVTDPEERAPSFYGKLGFDREVTDDLRLRLTGSAYTTQESLNNTLYSGDRAGSRYYLVLENTRASVSSNFTSGRINPNLRDHVTSFMINPFVQFRGLELFGLIERAEGGNDNEPEDRTWNQYAVEAIYRFLPRDQLYVGGRYNVVTGALAGSGAEVSVDRIQVGAGWFVTPNILVKGEYVRQNYDDFPTTDIRHGGAFDGLVIEGVIAF